MSVKAATPTTTPTIEVGEGDSFFLDTPVVGQNEFGGDIFEGDEGSSEPANRGDELILDDLPEDDPELNPDEEAEEEEAEEEEAEEEESEEEEAEEEESEEEESEEEEDGDDGERKPIPNKVPRTRLNKEIEKNKRLQEKLDALEAAQGREPEPEAQHGTPKARAYAADPEKFKAMQDAIIDGDTETAQRLHNELMQAGIDAAFGDVDALVERKLAAAEVNRELSTASKNVVASFPELDRTSDDYDQDIEQDVVALRDFYMTNRRMTPGEALTRAAREVAKDYELEDRAAKPAEQEEKPKPKAKRRATDIERKAKLAEKERGRLGGDSTPNKDELPDVSKLTDEQFERLDPSVKAKMRGDTF